MGKIPKSVKYIPAVAVVAVVAGFYFWQNLEKFLPPNLIPPDSFWVDMGKPLREQTQTVEIAGVTLEIPKMYFDTRMRSSKQDSILLKFIWPNMQSILELDS